MNKTFIIGLIAMAFVACNTPAPHSETDSDSSATHEEKVAVAVKGTRYVDTIFTRSQIITDTRQYSNDPDYFLTAYYAPAKFDTSKHKAWIVWLHGGGKDKDDKSCQKYGYYFAQLGYSFVSINYTSGDESMGKFTPGVQKEAVYDLWACLNYIRSNATDFRVNPSWGFSAGQSAGAITVYQGNIGSWVSTDSYFREWNATPNPRNLGFPITVLASATLSGAAKGIFEKWIPMMKAPNAFYTGGQDDKVAAKKQIDNFNKMFLARVPHIYEPIWSQTIFPDADHTLEQFDSISHKMTLQFYSLIK